MDWNFLILTGNRILWLSFYEKMLETEFGQAGSEKYLAPGHEAQISLRLVETKIFPSFPPTLSVRCYAHLLTLLPLIRVDFCQALSVLAFWEHFAWLHVMERIRKKEWVRNFNVIYKLKFFVVQQSKAAHLSGYAEHLIYTAPLTCAAAPPRACDVWELCELSVYIITWRG